MNFQFNHFEDFGVHKFNIYDFVEYKPRAYEEEINSKLNSQLIKYYNFDERHRLLVGSRELNQVAHEFPGKI